MRKNLKIAYIQPLKPDGSKLGDKIEVLFNPAEYTIEKGNTFQSTSLPGLATPVTQFVTGNADTLSMELFFDTYSPSSRHPNVSAREDVRNHTRRLAELMDVNPQLHAPPIVEFVWGKPLGSPEGIQFRATIEKLTQKFTLFLDDGTPVRATLNVTFKEYKTVEDQLKEIGRESADRTTRRVVKEGELIWMYAAEEYEDAGRWRVIADENGLENPRLLVSGRELIIPPLPEPEGGQPA